MLNFSNNPNIDYTNSITTNDNTFNLIPLESILSDIYRLVGTNSPLGEDDLLESAANGLEHMLNYKMYEKVACLKVINDHIIEIPESYRNVEAVLYTPELIEEDLSEMNETTTVDVCNEVVTKKSFGKFIGCSCLNNWSWLDLGHSIGTMVSSCAKVPPLGRSCSHTYSVGRNIIKVSPRTGYAIVIYKRILRDDITGMMLMPDNVMIKTALKNFILMEIYERKVLAHEEGSIGMYDRYLRQWELTSANAVAEMLMPSLPEWIEIVKTNRFYKDDSPYRIFDNSSFEKFNPF